MTSVPPCNFKDPRYSIAQSVIRESVIRQTANSSLAGLFATHPVMQASNHVLLKMYRGEITSADHADEEFRRFRADQQNGGSTAPEGDLSLLTCLELIVRFLIAWILDDQAKMNEILSEFEKSTCDWLEWAGAFLVWFGHYCLGLPAYYKAPLKDPEDPGGPFVSPRTFPLPPSRGGTLRVGILGDWGTGEPRAVAVLDQLMQQRPDLIIHVGDVYYAGTETEQNHNFLERINAAREKHQRRIPVYALPGNHDYYSGGAPFYTTVPRLNEGIPDASTQINSFWALVNERWQLQGMDTGYNDSDFPAELQDFTFLRDDEAAWHLQHLGNTQGRTVILFSHHQLVSAFLAIGGEWTNSTLEMNLARWQEAGANVAAWLWGHEHVLEVYEPYKKSPDSPFAPVLGRCIGHGAFPVFTDSGAYEPDPHGFPLLRADRSPDGKIPFPNGFVQLQPDDKVWASGYAILDLPDTGDATACYYQVMFKGVVETTTSQLVWRDSIPGAPAPSRDTIES